MAYTNENTEMENNNHDHHRFPSLPRPKSLSKQSFKVCFCCKRRFRLKVAEPPEDVKKVFECYSENGKMSVDQLVRFLEEYQGERNTTREDAHAIFSSLRHFNILRRGLHLEAFFRYLLSDANSALPSKEVHHDMNSPLAHYFLYTGHNSYLKGNQFTSESSVVPIIRALKRGVRVIELDLWPNQTNDDVEVRHGGTFTTSVELIACLGAIKEHAFTASEYPVIITFEDHLTQDLQAKVAIMVTRTFEDKLFRSHSELKELPSPEELKGKILISTKPPKERARKEEHAEIKNQGVDYSISNTDKKDVLDERQNHQDKDIEGVIPEYANLISIHAGRTKGGVDYWFLDDPNKAKRISLSEQELDSAIITHGTDIIRFTQRNLLRVYPKGTRLDSSNYNPLVGWAHGAQMVAFNMQGYDKYLWIMQGMFRANGGCGFVKKPDFLLKPDNVFDPYVELLVKTTLKVKVYMGEGWHLDFRHDYFDPYSPPDFYTKVGIAGVPLDMKKEKTRAIEDQWFPMWNQEFEFPLRVPELALLRIQVMEFDTTGTHGFGGQLCLPVPELRNGIRCIPLHDRRGEKYRSVKLLMRFQFV